MAEKSVEERISAIEAQLGTIPIEDHFREQAELIDRVFVYRFEEFERKWEARLESFESRLGSVESRLESVEFKLGSLESRIESFETRFESLESRLEAMLESKLELKLEAKLDAKLKPVRIDLALVKHAVGVILTRLN